MRHLLDFLYEHSFDKVLFCVLPADDGDVQVTWRVTHAATWEVQRARHVEHVPREDLLAHLTILGADLVAFERELGSLVAAHVVVADHVLRAAHEALGNEGVQLALRAQQDFVQELREALRPLHAPRLRLVR
ncbi:MAG: hypothetical protein ABW352_24745 [Polyangiales bacterium]